MEDNNSFSLLNLINIFFSLFQYSERTIASTETNDTSTERSDSHLFGAGMSEGVALSGGLHGHLPQKDIEKKVNLTEPSQDAIFFLITPILFLYYEPCVCLRKLK